MTRKIVVLGGTLSGPTAATRARELDDRAEITLVQRGKHVSFGFAGLAYHLSGEVASVDALDREGAALFENYYNIRVLTGTEATALDTGARTLAIQRDGKRDELAYDSLVFALGARSIAVAGVSGANVRVMRTLRDVTDVRAALARGERRFAVIGGGTFGLEAVDGLVRAGASVTLIESQPQLLPRFGTQIARTLELHLRSRGVGLHLGATITGVTTTGERVTALQLGGGARVEVDHVLVCAGVRPRTELLAAAGVPLLADHTVAIDDRAETAVAGIFACGSCVSATAVVTGKHVWWAQAAHADKAAQVAGTNAAGGSDHLVPQTGAMLVRALDLGVGRSGLAHDEATREFGAADVDRAIATGPSHDSYLPSSHPLLIELVSQRSTGRVLGVEAIGRSGVDKRIDVATVAIATAMTVEQLARIDLGYAAPFASSRDCINTVATIASAERAGLGRSLTPAELREVKQPVQLVDVREAQATAGLAGARHVPLVRLRASLDTLDAKVPIVVYSTRGRRGWLALRILRQHGFDDVANLAGGLEAWQREALS